MRGRYLNDPCRNDPPRCERDDDAETPRMKIKVGKYMTADPIGITPHEVYWIQTRDGKELGHVEWSPGWKCYAFQPADDTEFSADCLDALARFAAEVGP